MKDNEFYRPRDPQKPPEQEKPTLEQTPLSHAPTIEQKRAERAKQHKKNNQIRKAQGGASHGAALVMGAVAVVAVSTAVFPTTTTVSWAGLWESSDGGKLMVIQPDSYYSLYYDMDVEGITFDFDPVGNELVGHTRVEIIDANGNVDNSGSKDHAFSASAVDSDTIAVDISLRGGEYNATGYFYRVDSYYDSLWEEMLAVISPLVGTNTANSVYTGTSDVSGSTDSPQYILTPLNFIAEDSGSEFASIYATFGYYEKSEYVSVGVEILNPSNQTIFSYHLGNKEYTNRINDPYHIDGTTEFELEDGRSGTATFTPLDNGNRIEMELAYSTGVVEKHYFALDEKGLESIAINEPDEQANSGNLYVSEDGWRIEDIEVETVLDGSERLFVNMYNSHGVMYIAALSNTESINGEAQFNHINPTYSLYELGWIAVADFTTYDNGERITMVVREYSQNENGGVDFDNLQDEYEVHFTRVGVEPEEPEEPTEQANSGDLYVSEDGWRIYGVEESESVVDGSPYLSIHMHNPFGVMYVATLSNIESINGSAGFNSIYNGSSSWDGVADFTTYDNGERITMVVREYDMDENGEPNFDDLRNEYEVQFTRVAEETGT